MLLDANTLVHLSRMPALTVLIFALGTTLPDQITPSKLPLIFSNLGKFELSSEFLYPISSLLSKSQLPAVTDFRVVIESCPIGSEFSSFVAGVQTCCVGQVIQELSFTERFILGSTRAPWASGTMLGSRDLRPWMRFSNLRLLEVDIQWKVDLMDSELLTLASAWPRLECLIINDGWGWGTLGGITPNGLLQLLQTCPSLSRAALAIDTRGYSTLSQSPAFLGWTFPPEFTLHVVDSFIEAESVPAIAAFFAGIASRSNFVLRAWARRKMKSPNQNMCRTLWYDVLERINDVGEHSVSSHSFE